MTGDRHVAAFLDRDGTLIDDRHYLADPELVRVLPGVAEAVRSLNDAGILAIVVTNQSGIAQGLLTEAQYEATRARLVSDLARLGARLDASYHCPHHPEVSGPCDCRKPGTGLYRRAAAALDVDLTRSLFVGDRWRDVAPALALHGFGCLVPSASTPADDVARARRDATVAPSLADAIALFRAGNRTR